MKNYSTVFKVGTRTSRLARIQTASALDSLTDALPNIRFDVVPCSSPGDRDQTTDLRESPADFFTRDLDCAVREGRLDAALHSAKDLPPEMPPDIDWFWLPWAEDPRDAWILRPGSGLADLPATPRIGVSSERRASYASARFPNARLQSIRGNIEQRLAQLDRGDVDAVIMAGAALLRLNLEHRIAAWISMDALPTPEGQGTLCLTFRAGDDRFQRLRGLFVKACVFVGAGTGDATSCTVAGIAALKRCDVCLYDALLDPALLDRLPAGAQRVSVGKRAGNHSASQATITRQIADAIRKGRRVVRLKGGDPGLFGRLAEEIDTLDALALPYRVVPGVSSLTAATTGTGLLLTRRGIARGFCALTPREQGGDIADVRAAARARLPLVFFMAAQVFNRVAEQLLDDGWPPATPVAFVIDAGGENETIARTRLQDAASRQQSGLPASGTAPVLCLVGSAASGGYRHDSGALGGRRILLTCSAALQQHAADCVLDAGGRPVRRPMIRLDPVETITRTLDKLDTYDWLVITSPSAVRCLLTMLRRHDIDVRRLPNILTCGQGTATALQDAGIIADATPEPDRGGTDALLDTAPRVVRSGQSVLRLRSDSAGSHLADALATHCDVAVDDVILYRNSMIQYPEPPAFDAALFASGSAVEALVRQWGASVLDDKPTVAIGSPTARVMQRLKLRCDAVSPRPDMESAVATLARLLYLRGDTFTKAGESGS